MSLPPTHLAVRLHPPSRNIRVETLPTPQIEHPDDAIVKVTLAGLCGSDLHPYRGDEPFDEPYVMGHEVVGEVVALGSNFASMGANVPDSRPELYRTLYVGCTVVSPFTTSCGECEPCLLGFSSRCTQSLLFGSPFLPGAQAQFVRVPHAGGTLHIVPSSTEALHPWLLVADILPTGYFAALQALQHPNMLPITLKGSSPFPGSLLLEKQAKSVPTTRLAVGIIGLGPVGLCALISLLDLLEGFHSVVTVFAVDPVTTRREKATAIVQKIALPQVAFIVTSPEDALEAVGVEMCHAVLEVVGNNSALQLAYTLIRPFGVISSVGVHTSPTFPLLPADLYTKNVSLSFGRCPVRSFLPQVIRLLDRRQDIFREIGGKENLIERVVGFKEDEVRTAYERFEKNQGGKVLFDPWRV